jgi:CheY-like chemotaxis protein
MADNILIVDDDRKTLELLRKGIGKYFPDLQVLTAGNGREALEQIQSNETCLVITDLMMPVMDGFELITQLMARYPDISVIVITGNTIPEAERQRFTDGTLTVLSKPFAMQALCDNIAQMRHQHAEGGILHNIAPSMFLQLVELEGKTSTIRVVENVTGKQGVLFFSKGQLLDARMADLQGEAAAREIAAWDKTSLVIQNSCPVKTSRISRSISALLLDAARIKDERSDLDNGLPVVAAEDLIDVGSTPSDNCAVPHDLRQRIEQDAELRPHLKQIRVEPQWQQLLSHLSMFSDYFRTGPLQSIAISTGLAEDVIVIPTNPPVAVRVDPRCPKDKVLALIEDR